jgi:O-Antigen ligase
MVVAFAFGSSSDPDVRSFGLIARWVVLATVCGIAMVVAVRKLRHERSLPAKGLLRFSAIAAAFLALAIVSTGWSVSPRLTFDRAGSLGLLFLLAAALASSTAADLRARVRLFQGLAAGAIAVGVISLVYLAVNYDSAVQPVTKINPWRYRGITQNPNTISILAGAALPIVVAMAVISKNRWRQAGWLAGGLLLLGSIIAAESRGGLLAACAGSLVVTAFGVEGRRQRVAAVAALLTAFGGGIALRQIAQPPPPTFSSEVAPAPAPPAAQPSSNGAKKGTGKARGKKAQPPKTKPSRPHKPPAALLVLHGKTEPLPNEQDEIGHPQLSKSATTTVASGRIAAWEGALELIGDRPLLGYGFGMEQKVFIDRWYFFQGGSPENSFLGVLLQLGAIGLALLLAMGCAVAIGGIRVLHVLRGDERVLQAAALGVFVAAAAIMMIQSYLYSVGNVASATVWISLFILGTAALEPRRERAPARLPAATHEVAA